MRTINTLVIHCAATPNGYGKYTIRDIDAWHASRGFRRDVEHLEYNPTLPYIGYHGIIDCNGVLWAGRGEDEIGQHAVGLNATSLGYCLMGTDKFTAAQWGALRDLIEDHQNRYDTEDFKLNIIGHEVVSNKTCPGFDVSVWLAGGMEPLQEHLL